ncbi:hypothetical protein FBU31_003105 [Coemansia sp. 'formosensis']|nr:hypothetical protein FBU31_003105 [Coemansia sp. 'formosensis']
MFSPFQLLPEHVARKIVGYLSASTRLAYNGFDPELICSPQLTIPLLSTCHIFRKIVYCEFSEDKFINVNGPEDYFQPLLSGSQPHNRFPSYMARTVYFVATLDLIYSGMALQEQQKWGLFPRARKIALIVLWPCSTDDDSLMLDIVYSPDTEANITAFVQGIKEIVPLLNEISVFPSTPSNVPDSAGVHFSSLVSQLFGIVDRASYSMHCYTMPMTLQSNVADLVFFNYYSANDYILGNRQHILDVARRSAHTLQHLAIEVSLALDMSGLVKNPEYVVYPCLTKLRLATAPPPSRRHEYDPQQASSSVKQGTLRSTLPSVASGVVLFPSLKSLTIIKSYPFADDAPFRGNAKRLQYLRLLLTRNICSILHRRSVFTPTSHPQLQYVEVEFPSTDVYDYFETNDKYLKFALTLGSNSAVRAIRGIQSASKRVPVLTLLQGHESIQMLILYDTRLVLQDVFRLVKWLPLLSDLHCLSLYYGSQPYPTGGKYAKHMYAVRNMERPRFRCLRIGFDMDFNVDELVDELVECVLYIALRFPSFDYTAVTDDILPEFMETMEQSIALDAYQPYAPRLRRLLFNKPV